MRRCFVVVSLIVGFAGPSASAQTAGMLSFQGLIKDAGGNPITGSVNLEFRIFDAETLGGLVDMNGDGVVENVIGQDVKQVLSVSATDGILSTKFGPVAPSSFDGNPRWLEVSVDGSPLSRVEMVTAPATAEQLNLVGKGMPMILVDDPNSFDFLVAANGGGLNLNVTSPDATAHIELTGGGAGAATSFIDFTDAQHDFITRIQQQTSAAGGAFIISNMGNADTALRVERNGVPWLQVSQTATKVRALQITGGADLAEPFTIANQQNKNRKIESGLVMVIDPARPGQLKVANAPYDRKVAGVSSGANGLSPGMVMKGVDASLVSRSAALGAVNAHPVAYNAIRTASVSDRSSVGRDAVATSEHNVALTGRVWCWCDASYGAITPGDRLTTSATPGHAMKVTDNVRGVGAVIGKAMTPLNDGRGLVLVLVQPQ